MSREQDNKAIASRWFTEFWGNPCDLAVVDELAAPDILLQYSSNARRRGHDDVKAFMQALREAFPDLRVRSAVALVARGDYVMGQREGDGTHTGSACVDFPAGAFPATFRRRMRFTGTTMLRFENGKIVEETVWTTGLTVFRPLRRIEVGDRCRGMAVVPRPATAHRRTVPG